MAATAAEEAERLLANAKQALRRARVKAAELRERGEHDAAAGRRRRATRQIVAQTHQRVAGVTPDGATRRVSLHDADARPIAKGRLGAPGPQDHVFARRAGVTLGMTVGQVATVNQAHLAC